MLSSKFVFVSIIFLTKCTNIFTYFIENAAVPTFNFDYSRSNERSLKRVFKKEWLPVGFCDSGIPLLKSKFCNGKQDCSDGSDETAERCSSNGCQNDYFRCNYGGCIAKISICDGIYQCADGSDEEHNFCQRSNCMIPYPTADTVYFVKGCEECSCGSQVKEGSILSHQCLHKGFSKVKSTDVICQNGIWTPSVPTCKGTTIKGVGNKISTTESNEVSSEYPTFPPSFSSKIPSMTNPTSAEIPIIQAQMTTTVATAAAVATTTTTVKAPPATELTTKTTVKTGAAKRTTTTTPEPIDE